MSQQQLQILQNHLQTRLATAQANLTGTDAQGNLLCSVEHSAFFEPVRLKIRQDAIEIVSIFVRRKERKKGNARALCNAVVDAAREMNKQKVCVEKVADEEDSTRPIIAFWTAVGFVSRTPDGRSADLRI
ncbi:GNAT family N-acetyltransferase [Pandoraea pneumonica]|uniref:GNAT family N-acetyltransferase n=1 Tax=Pandoraea pneumonica TaxID=2508299 RepID=UPI003CFAD0AB